MNRPDVQACKLQIEQRYNRLSNGHRRPSFEYLEPKEIKEIFSRENVANLDGKTDSELLEFYTQWYETNFPIEATDPKEVILPEIEK